MRRHAQVVAWLLLGLALGACGKTKDSTALVVTVWTDFAVPGEMDAITIRVTSAQKKVEDHIVKLSSVQPGKPALQYALVPGGADTESITVEAAGSLANAEMVWQRATVPFIADQQHELVLFLGKNCLGKRCQDQANTCDQGQCRKPVVPEGALPPYIPGQPTRYPDASVVEIADAGGAEVSGAEVSGAEVSWDGGLREVVSSAEAGGADVPALLPDAFTPDAAEEDVPLATGGASGTGGTGTGGDAGPVPTGGNTGGNTGSEDAGLIATGGVGGTFATAGAPGSGGVDGGAVDAPVSSRDAALDGTGGNSALGDGAAGATSTGGSATAGATVGGATSSGGASSPGGTTSSGGAASGGAAGTGGAAGGTTTGGTTASGGSSGGATAPSSGPCDIYAAAATPTPCVAAYSVIRVLSKSYTGPLFQVRAGSSSTNNTMSGGTTKDIMPGLDGYVDSATVDEACGATYCTVSRLYDQSGNLNHLARAPYGSTAGGQYGAQDDFESIATGVKVKAGGHTVYSLYMNRLQGYRTAAGVAGKNMPRGNASQGIYELADGTRQASACCWDFGNVITDPAAGWAYADALCFERTWWGKGQDGDTSKGGPWFGVEFEGGVWAGGSVVGDPGYGSVDKVGPVNPNNPTLKVPFALGFLRVSSATYTIKAADLSTATALSLAYDGPVPMQVNHQGGIVLGTGTDNSNNSWGTFHEGAILAGYPDNDTDLAVMMNLKAVGYALP